MTTGGLVPNTFFNGKSDINLLSSSKNKLEPHGAGSVSFKINVKVDPGEYYNVAFSQSVANNSWFSDSSITGSDPDPDHNGNPTDNKDTGTLVSIPDIHLRIPEGFSPNGDHVNDEFVIDGLQDYPSNSLIVFNRWGSVVFEKENYDSKWNGFSTNKLTLGSQPLPSGTYFYVLKLGGIKTTDIKGYIFINP